MRIIGGIVGQRHAERISFAELHTLVYKNPQARPSLRDPFNIPQKIFESWVFFYMVAYDNAPY